MEDDEHATRPVTIGELRRRLKGMGEPWTVPARFNDEDPLPDPPRGGQPVEPGHVQGLRAVSTAEEFEACLRQVPPGNPFLAARWRELGLAVPGTVEGTADGVPMVALEGDVPEWPLLRWPVASGRETGSMTVRRVTSVFAGFRFPPEVISLAVRWYLRYGLSCRDVEELLAERGITVDHVTVYRWGQRFTPEFIEAARLCRHAPGDRWFADETYVKVAGRWNYLYRAIDQHGQVIDVLLSARRDPAAARRFFIRALRAGTIPAEVTTDRASAYPRVLDELIPSALHTVERYANNSIETDHGRLKARLRPMRGLKRHRSARTLAAGHAFVQNLRRGHYELATDVPARHRIRAAFDQLTMAI